MIVSTLDPILDQCFNRRVEQVNLRLSKILSSLYPTLLATLTPTAEGLSLTLSSTLDPTPLPASSLSGGQRSLIALALVLATHHKSPILVLDEVDAALDDTHTLKLGEMLKNIDEVDSHH